MVSMVSKMSFNSEKGTLTNYNSSKATRIQKKEINDKTKEKSDTYLAKGKPAIFKQQLEDGSLISLQANEIKYQPDLNLITVSGNAQVKQAGSKVTGEIITYNTLNEKLEAQGSSNDSVTTILQPAQIKAQQDKKNNDSNKQ